MSTALDKTIARADEFLKRFRDKPVAHLIDGKQDPGNGQTFETHSPIDNSVIAKVARGGAAEIDKAARAGAIFQVESMNGVFHGVMTPTGPIGWRIV